MFTFFGDTWVDAARASADCFVGASCVAACACPVPASAWPLPGAVWLCVLCCVVAFELPAVLEAEFELFPAAAACVESEDACALWSVEALWTTVCDWPPPPAPPVCVCVLFWLVELVFVADADALFELV
jgi:hypothetical protein